MTSFLPAPLGAGISLRRSFLQELADRVSRGEKRIGWLEIVPENFLGRGGAIRRALLQLSEALPIALHGVTLSIGSTDPLHKDYLRQLGALARETRARWFTDHFSYSSAGGVQFHNLMPLPFTREAVKHLVRRIKEVKSYLGLPFGLENPSFYAAMPGSKMTEADFISEVLEKADCHLLLDINNVYVNACNLGDPERAIEESQRFIRSIPLERVIEVHIAGHKKIRVNRKPILLDTHGADVAQPVRELLVYLNKLRPVQTLLLERENQLPPLDDIIDEAASLWHLVKPKPVFPKTFPAEAGGQLRLL